jgi:hypothetical protein
MTEPQVFPGSEELPPIGIRVPPNASVPLRGMDGTNGAGGVKKQPEPDEPVRNPVSILTLVLESSPPWLISMIFHMLLLIIMALVAFSQIQRSPVQLSAEVATPDNVSEQLETEAPGLPEGSDEGTSDVLAPKDLPVVDDPLASPGSVPVRPGGYLATGTVEAPGLSWVLKGRAPGRPRRF